ncbi:hypothetical protein [Vibrio sp. qd031]|uniref:hypothetical protein n=1 Tax=Vibrio sp. qd031 TaxID=1603038 RepID=UPI00117D6742|nr:hypothetical protein [Vibrio sp. qd031]
MFDSFRIDCSGSFYLDDIKPFSRSHFIAIEQMWLGDVIESLFLKIEVLKQINLVTNKALVAKSDLCVSADSNFVVEMLKPRLENFFNDAAFDSVIELNSLFAMDKKTHFLIFDRRWLERSL